MYNKVINAKIKLACFKVSWYDTLNKLKKYIDMEMIMDKKPNIVILMTDSQGADMVGAYGLGDELQTKNLDKLAESGVKFTKAYTSSPLCAPARGSLFTGMTPSNTGVVTNGQSLMDNVKSMGQVFSEEGYNCAYIGKWHLDGHDYFGTGECPPGWDPEYWYDGRNYMDDMTDDEKVLWRKGLNSLEDLKNHNITEEFCWANKNSNKAIDYLQKEHEDPFLLVVSYDEPHHPWICPPEYLETFQGYKYPLTETAFDDLSDKPAHLKTWSESIFGISEPKEYFSHDFYFASNSYVDYEIGRVVDEIKEKYGDDTIIVYTSDHGEMHGAHRLKSKGPVAYEEITRVPFIISGPERLVKSGVNSTNVSHIDVMPTIMDYAGIPVTQNLSGGSLKEFIKDGKTDEDRSVFMEYTRYENGHDGFGAYNPYRCIKKGDWKLTIHLHNIDELYNLEADPGESKNLINEPEYKVIRNELFTELMNRMDETRDIFRGSYWHDRPWRVSIENDWEGVERPKPDDGQGRIFYDYNNGVPMDKPVERA